MLFVQNIDLPNKFVSFSYFWCEHFYRKEKIIKIHTYITYSSWKDRFNI